MSMIIETERLQLRPHEPAELLALIEGVPQYEARSGLKVADGLRDFFVSGDVSQVWLDDLREAAGPDPWTIGFAVIERDGGTVIGSAGFKGPPGDEGIVEVAYGIVPGCQGKGYASEATRALLRFASGQSQVQVVRAHTLPGPNASTGVLSKCGFHFLGEVTDPEDGLVWRWERSMELI